MAKAIANKIGIGSMSTTKRVIKHSVNKALNQKSLGGFPGSHELKAVQQKPLMNLLNEWFLSALSLSFRVDMLKIKVHINPAAIAGIRGLNRSDTSNCKLAAALTRGPPQGIIFITPALKLMTQASIIRFIPSFVYKGSKAETVIKM